MEEITYDLVGATGVKKKKHFKECSSILGMYKSNHMQFRTCLILKVKKNTSI